MATEGTIKRRRRVASAPIAEGERKNVTFIAGAETYNRLVEASQTSGRSISELLEMHLNKNLVEKVTPKFEQVFFGTPQSLELLRNYALVLSTYDKQNDWREHEATQAGILAAITALNARFFSLDTEKFGVGADASDPKVAELNAAWGAGAQLGTLLAGPLSPVEVKKF